MTFTGCPGVLPPGHKFLVTHADGRYLKSAETRSGAGKIMLKYTGAILWQYRMQDGGFAWVKIDQAWGATA